MSPHFELSASRLRATFLSLLFVFCVASQPCQAEILREDNNSFSRELKLPIITWADASSKTKALVLALHGMTMHAGTFDALARQLVSEGYLVVALDMRGFGHWMEGTSDIPADKAVNYERSQVDLVNLLTLLRQNYPSLPLFCLGESLGADEILRAAASQPQLMDGLILSSPGIRRRSFISKHTICKFPLICTNPCRQLDISQFMKYWASEDPKIIEGMLEDPLVRRRMSSAELLKSKSFLQSTLKYVDKVPAHLPVLIIQGDGDRILKSNAVVLLLQRLKSKDQMVRWFHERGHILLETAHVQPDTVDTVRTWLSQHTDSVVHLKAAQARGSLAAEANCPHVIPEAR